MAFDYRLPASRRAWLERLDPFDKEAVLAIVNAIAEDPYPDGKTKRALPPYFPYAPGSVVCYEFGVIVRYRISQLRANWLDILSISFGDPPDDQGS